VNALQQARIAQRAAVRPRLPGVESLEDLAQRQADEQDCEPDRDLSRRTAAKIASAAHTPVGCGLPG
jgi:hypothetical protein